MGEEERGERRGKRLEYPTAPLHADAGWPEGPHRESRHGILRLPRPSRVRHPRRTDASHIQDDREGPVEREPHRGPALDRTRRAPVPAPVSGHGGGGGRGEGYSLGGGEQRGARGDVAVSRGLSSSLEDWKISNIIR